MDLLPPAYEVYFRLAVGAFVIVGPSALFIGLWRGLMALRDDRLIERMLDEAPEPYRGPEWRPAAFLGAAVGSARDRGSSAGDPSARNTSSHDASRCPYCDTALADSLSRCSYCGSPVGHPGR